MQSPKILITGATGYIGGSLLTHFLKTTTTSIKSANFSVLLRNASQAPLFASLNVTPIVLSDPDSLEEIRKVAADYDIIINPAYGTMPDQSKALVLGLGDRLNSNPSGPIPHLIQTSGTSDLSDRPFTLVSRKLAHSFTDLESAKNYEVEKKLAAEEPYGQRDAELAVIDTGLEVGIKTHNIMSPTIYGPGTGPGNNLSIQIPLLIRAVVRNGFANYVGEGAQEWDHISISDLASLYEVLLARVIEGKDVASGKNAIFFSESGRHSWKWLMQAIVDAGVKLGKVKQGTEVKSLELQAAADAWGIGAMPAFAELGFASNSRTKADVARSWGWTPKDDLEGFKRGIEEDWKAVAAKDGF